MALRIIRASEPIVVKNIVVGIYGAPGIGKTSLGFSSDNPTLIDFDKGAHRAIGRKETNPVDRWEDVESIELSDVAEFNTIVVDTVGRLLDLKSISIMDSDYKMAAKGGSLSLQGYGALKSGYASWMSRVKSFGKDVVLLAHSDEQRRGDETVDRLDIQGGTKNEVHKSCDAIGRLYTENGQRKLNFSPTDVSFGKNPGKLPVLDVPDYEDNPNFLAEVIQKIKDRLNELSADQMAYAAVLSDWRQKIADAMTPEDFNLLVVDSKEVDANLLHNVKKMIWAGSTERGLKFDKTSNCFTQGA